MIEFIIDEMFHELIHEIKSDAMKNKNWYQIVQYCDSLLLLGEDNSDHAILIYGYLMQNAYKCKSNASMELLLRSMLMSDISDKTSDIYYITLQNERTYYVN